MAKSKHVMLKGVALATLVTAAVSLAHALKKNKRAKMLKASAMDAKANVVAHAKKLGGVSKKSYDKVVDSVIKEYRDMRTMTKQELADLAAELKCDWEEAKKTVKGKKASAKKKR